MDWQADISALAQEDFWEAIDYYGDINPALARDFARVVLIAAKLIHENPFIGQEAMSALCIWHLNRFPYTIYYETGASQIYILAILHRSLNPDSVRKRLSF
jgi:plasmid stabilization system protein ParE